MPPSIYINLFIEFEKDAVVQLPCKSNRITLIYMPSSIEVPSTPPVPNKAQVPSAIHGYVGLETKVQEGLRADSLSAPIAGEDISLPALKQYAQAFIEKPTPVSIEIDALLSLNDETPPEELVRNLGEHDKQPMLPAHAVRNAGERLSSYWIRKRDLEVWSVQQGIEDLTAERKVQLLGSLGISIELKDPRLDGIEFRKVTDGIAVILPSELCARIALDAVETRSNTKEVSEEKKTEFIDECDMFACITRADKNLAESLNGFPEGGKVIVAAQGAAEEAIEHEELQESLGIEIDQAYAGDMVYLINDLTRLGIPREKAKTRDFTEQELKKLEGFRTLRAGMYDLAARISMNQLWPGGYGQYGLTREWARNNPDFAKTFFMIESRLCQIYHRKDLREHPELRAALASVLRGYTINPDELVKVLYAEDCTDTLTIDDLKQIASINEEKMFRDEPIPVAPEGVRYVWHKPILKRNEVVTINQKQYTVSEIINLSPEGGFVATATTPDGKTVLLKVSGSTAPEELVTGVENAKLFYSKLVQSLPNSEGKPTLSQAPQRLGELYQHLLKVLDGNPGALTKQSESFIHEYLNNVNTVLKRTFGDNYLGNFEFKDYSGPELARQVLETVCKVSDGYLPQSPEKYNKKWYRGIELARQEAFIESNALEKLKGLRNCQDQASLVPEVIDYVSQFIPAPEQGKTLDYIFSTSVIVMEYVPGTTLESALTAAKDDALLVLMTGPDGKAAPLTGLMQDHLHFLESRLFLTCSMITDAYNMHKRGVTNRDLKPMNILFSPLSFYTRFIDFEKGNVDGTMRLNRLASRKLEDMPVSHAYTAPEVYIDYSDKDLMARLGISEEEAKEELDMAIADPLDKQADVFSLGMIMVRMITLKNPTVDIQLMPTNQATRQVFWQELVQMMNTAVPPVPSRMQDVIRKAVNPRRKGRYRDAYELYAEFVEACKVCYPGVIEQYL